eukprot:CAMPEP_0182438294 /NCGR_PEP_ID=MMETSP1167-20130531/85657_1 /TAXON_ID=2988 /ORGANISM="Mallomonas Sp, Strain CCMP3275" /LENGTH=337 /DNA_ID=CAMNT_0024631577 /DNA_START=116 /DNA_END=1129 /DNA_ORIENTATION=-
MVYYFYIIYSISFLSDTFTADYISSDVKNIAIVFTWHISQSRRTDVRWVSKTVGKGNEFKAVVFSIVERHPSLPIFLFTNSETIDDDLRKYITVINVDLMQEAGLNKLLESTGDSMVGFGVKPMSLIYGFQKGILPERILYLDVDVIITNSNESNEFNLLHIFDPLQYYDMAAVFEGFAIGPKPTPAVGRGWETNTGVLAVRKQALPLLEEWLAVIQKEYVSLGLGKYLSGEQQALMIALQRNPAYRLFPLPNIYNFRRATLHSNNSPRKPVAVLSHAYSDVTVPIAQYNTVGLQITHSFYEDAVYGMYSLAKPDFNCDPMIYKPLVKPEVVPEVIS